MARARSLSQHVAHVSHNPLYPDDTIITFIPPLPCPDRPAALVVDHTPNGTLDTYLRGLEDHHGVTLLVGGPCVGPTSLWPTPAPFMECPAGSVGKEVVHE